MEELEPKKKTLSPTLPRDGEGEPEEVTEEAYTEDEDIDDAFSGKSQQDVADELNGQLHLFDD